jgi:ABC-type lipoprotein export system ATPase subunit
MLAELIHITKTYDQPGTDIQTRVLEDVNLPINANDRIAIVGPSGSGKSTLLNILGSLDKPGSGTVILDGMDVALMREKQLATKRNEFIGFVFQSHHLLPQLSVMENVLLPLLPRRDRSAGKAAAERALHLLDRVGLASHIHRFPNQLSIGECQRAAVVRALINSPKLLLADEPTGSLDEANTLQLADLLLDLNREENVALVLVTHSLELAARMVTCYQLHSGRLILQ